MLLCSWKTRSHWSPVRAAALAARSPGCSQTKVLRCFSPRVPKWNWPPRPREINARNAQSRDGGVRHRRPQPAKPDCARVVAAAREKFGRIDILVNNAGHYGPVVPVEEYPLAEFDSVIAVHLRAAFLLSKLVLPEMYERGSGVILNISSLSAKSAFGWGSAYAAAKAGMLGLHARHRSGGCAQRSSRERTLPGTGHRDTHVQRTRRHPRARSWASARKSNWRDF